MKTVLVSLLLRNNEKYIPYMLKIFQNLDKSNDFFFKYLILTNDNEDNTLKLLEEGRIENMTIINEKIKEEIKNLKWTLRIGYFREKLLKQIRKESFDYLLMIDSDIFFNLKIVEESIKRLEKNDFEAVSTNTIHGVYPFYFFYDDFAFLDYEEKKLKGFTKLKFLIKNVYACNTLEVKSAFGGFFLTKRDIFLKKNLTYLKNKKEDICEHILFNKNFKIGFLPTINPIRMKGNESKNRYETEFNIIKKNNSDNRNITQLGLIISFLLVLIILFYIFNKLIN